MFDCKLQGMEAAADVKSRMKNFDLPPRLQGDKQTGKKERSVPTMDGCRMDGVLQRGEPDDIPKWLGNCESASEDEDVVREDI